MKVKNLFITFGLSLALGVVAAVGAGQKVEKAEAAISETKLYIDYSGSYWVSAASPSVTDIKAQIWGGTNGDVYFDSSKDSWSTIEVDAKTYVVLDMTGNQDFTGMQVYCWDYSGNGNISVGISPSSFSDGKNLIIVGSSDSWSTKQPVTFGTLVVGTTYTITKYAVYDGVLDSEYPLGTDSVVSGNTYAVPARINKTGYHFGGWFTTSACDVTYTAKAITANTPIYAKYTTLVNDSYVYYVTGTKTDTTNYIYSFGGDGQYGSGTGVAITSIATEVHGVVRFQNVDQYIYKIPYSTTAGDTHIILNKNAWGGENQTSNMQLVSHSAYWWTQDDNYHNDDAGAALDFIFAVETKRNAVAADVEKGIKQYSICGISAADSLALCNSYNALTKTQREDYVDISYTFTYKRTDSSQNDNVSFYDIMEQLAKQAGGVALAGHSASRLVPVSSTGSSNAVVVIIAIIASFSLITIAGCFLIKRKHN